MADTDASIAAPSDTPPTIHPMDPRRGENISPRFAAVLAWLLQLPPMTTPAITGISISGNALFAATSTDPFHDTAIGDLADVVRNLRDWGAACGVDEATVDALVARLKRAGL